MRVLVVEDDLQTALYVRDGLVTAGFEVDVAEDGAAGLERARGEPFDVLVIDRMLPGLDGLMLVRALREGEVQTPVLFLTAMGAIGDRVEGLEGGGDDYPSMRGRDEARLRNGDLTLDRLQRTVTRGERRIELLPLQFKLLEFLLLHEGDVVTRTMLLEGVWGLRFDPRTNIVETHISHLRGKIDPPGEPSLIVTVRGAGYSIRAR
jgi:two-component system, OmpR family, response regulator